ncbi:MAG: Peptidase, M23/M37 family [Bacteroidetes bacterium HLUCCA01]|nr:MAG: Peptidase, M23/M37 family [Bacteroidetes bacterium HLUCCA01]
MSYYYYDKDECKFVPVQYDAVDRLIHTVSQLLLYGIVISGVVISMIVNYAGTPSEIALRAENRELTSQLRHTRATILQLDEQLDQLVANDNELYRTVLGLDPISMDERMAGTGGSDRIAGLNIYQSDTSELLRWTLGNLESIERRVNIQQLSFEEIKAYYNENQQKLQHIPAIRPINSIITSGFGPRMHPVYRFRRPHEGIDFRARIGTPIYATGDGVISMAGTNGTYGITIKIDHGFGYESLYAHLSGLETGIRTGRRVKRGDLIGFTGDTGVVEGPHLHYEIIRDGRAVDPLYYMFADLSPDEYIAFRRIADTNERSMD